MDSKTLCLAVLTKGDASGYEIKKTLESAPFSHFQETSFGSIYPALTRLTEQGLVRFHEMAQDKRPDKKVYSITAKGREAFFDALVTPPSDDKVRSDFLFHMMFAHLLAPGALEYKIDERMEILNASIARLEKCADEGFEYASEAFINGYALTIYRAMADYIEDNRHQLVGASLLPARAVAE